MMTSISHYNLQNINDIKVSFEEIDTISQNIGRKLREKANKDTWTRNYAKYKIMRGEAYNLGYRMKEKQSTINNVIIRILIYLLTNLKKTYDVQIIVLYYYLLLLFITSTRNIRNFTYIVALRNLH